MIAARVYRLALGAFPKRHRDLYAAEMLFAFQQQFEAAARAGRVNAIRFLMAAIGNAIAMGTVERRRYRVVRLGYAFSALDFTLAWRMLLRYPGLTIVGVFGMAVGIAVAAGAASIVFILTDVRLPLPQGDRIVSVIAVDAEQSSREVRLISEFPSWRGMQSMAEMGIARQVSRNLIVEGRQPEAITVIELSASAFRIAGVPALRGRHLLPEDEQGHAPDVVVIGSDEWVRRFGGDPGIIGRSVQIGGKNYEVAGVMPDGFGFPANSSFWIPWRLESVLYPARTGPIVTIFGRLAPGATLESAQAELDAINSGAAASSPATHQHLRSRIVPYTYAYTDMGDPGNMIAMRAIQLALVMLLVTVCVNVAILVYARTATRHGEIAVRGALGASRARIVSQLFVEALTMAAVAAVIGLCLVSVAMPQLEAAFLEIVGGRLPFWMNFRLSADGIIYIVGLTLLAAGIVGVLPALKATGRNVHAGLQTLSPGSGSRMQMGRLWTLLIVAQVAFTVALLPIAMFFTWDGLRLRTGNAGFASGEFLSVTLAMDRSAEPPAPGGDTAFASRYAASHARLEQRLRSETAVIDLTYSLTDAGQELAMAAEAEGRSVPDEPVDYNISAGSDAGYLVRYNRVAINFFEAFDVPVVIGRHFTAVDLGTDHILVNRHLADTMFGGENPLGRRIRYVGRSRETEDDKLPLERWHEIVGVVPDFPVNELEPVRRIFHPAAVAELVEARIALRIRAGDPLGFSGRLREISAAVDPNLQIRDVTTTELIVRREQGLFRIIGVTVGLTMLSVVVLSAAGIYSLMSFTVSRRRREIGIRAALGADRNRLLIGIFSRALVQLGTGAAVGMVGACGIERLQEGAMLGGYGVVILPAVVLIMMTVGVLAAIGPARQGLRIQPIEALREE